MARLINLLVRSAVMAACMSLIACQEQAPKKPDTATARVTKTPASVFEGSLENNCKDSIKKYSLDSAAETCIRLIYLYYANQQLYDLDIHDSITVGETEIRAAEFKHIRPNKARLRFKFFGNGSYYYSKPNPDIGPMCEIFQVNLKTSETDTVSTLEGGRVDMKTFTGEAFRSSRSPEMGEYLRIFDNRLHKKCRVAFNPKPAPKDYSPVKDIPRNKHGDYSVFYQLLSEEGRKIGIGNLDTGFDSLRIRIWYPERRIRKVAVISKTSEGWNAAVYYYTSFYDVMSGTDMIERVVKEVQVPKSGWSTFRAGLLNSGITTLPNMQHFAGDLGKGADGDTYCVEIATTKKYRFYYYSNPYNYVHMKKIKRFTEIIDLLDREFHYSDTTRTWQ